MTNTERQRLFRQRHPGYYQRLHAKRRAMIKARRKQRELEKAYLRMIIPPVQLCLPAPDQVSTVNIDFIAMFRAEQDAEALAARPIGQRHAA